MYLGTAQKLPFKQLSASSITDLIACPEQFRQKRLLRKTDPMNVPKFVGIVDHQTHARNFRQKIESKVDLTQDEMFSSYASEWLEVTEREGEPEWGEGDAVKTYEKGQEMVRLYHQEVSPRVFPIAVEERFELTIPGIPIPVVGYIDVEEAHQIRERKTAATKLSKPKPRWRFQGRVYQLATGKPVTWDVVTKQVTPQVVTALEAPGLLMGVQNPDATAEMIRQAYGMLTYFWERYGADRPWPTNGTFSEWGCQYCPFSGDCVAWA